MHRPFRTFAAALGMIVALPAGWAFGFAPNYHEALALCCWRARFRDAPPTPENGGIYFLLAASAADIRGTTRGVKPLPSYPDAWSPINWRSLHTGKGSAEFLRKLAADGPAGWSLADVMRKATPEALETEFESGRVLNAAAISQRQRWIARGWALHNLCDYLGAHYRLREMPGGGQRYFPEKVLIQLPSGAEAATLDGHNDMRSVFWASLADMEPELPRRIAELVSDPKQGGTLLADFAFLLQRGYDSQQADGLGMVSGLERAQRVMLPVVNEFARGVGAPGLGRNFVFGWGVAKNHSQREAYARDVVLPELYRPRR